VGVFVGTLTGLVAAAVADVAQGGFLDESREGLSGGEAVAFIAGFAALGGVVLGLMGANSPTWEPLWAVPQPGADPAPAARRGAVRTSWHGADLDALEGTSGDSGGTADGRPCEIAVR
jgi:hypothetical protein